MRPPINFDLFLSNRSVLQSVESTIHPFLSSFGFIWKRKKYHFTFLLWPWPQLQKFSSPSDPAFPLFKLHLWKVSDLDEKTFYYFLLKILFKKYFCPFVDWGDGKIFKWVLLGIGCNSTVENMASCLKVVGWALWMLSSFLFLPFS